MRPVPAGRLARIGQIGRMASGVAGHVAVDGARAALRGQRPGLQALVMRPANIARIADRLSQMRGAAMKLGQLLSLEAGEMLPPELEVILAQLRADAHAMPPAQVKQVLHDAYGSGFRKLFRSFDTTPLAAASIGQVHRALSSDGTPLAVKLQYPGVRAAIDSDLANVASLIRWSGLWPPHLDLDPLLAESRVQLQDEADYAREGAALARFGTLLDGDARFRVPRPDRQRTNAHALAMSFEPSEPIETLAHAPPATRDAAVTALIDLSLRELFDFRLMQTDPNFANYRWRPDTGQVVLLDFGATREIPRDMSDGYRKLLHVGMAGDGAAILGQMNALGLIPPGAQAHHRQAILDMAEKGFAILRGPEPFDFKGNDFADRMRARGLEIGTDRELWHLPPPETLFVHRKIGGLYLLATRLGARVDLASLVGRYC